jgi:ribosomal-protein-alanine N-acetyltransferase
MKNLSPCLLPLKPEMIEAAVDIERQANAFPWSVANFEDCLKANYPAFILALPWKPIAGFMLYYTILDELHLLNICVCPKLQRKGLGRFMLDSLMASARDQEIRELWLEVRESNKAAIQLYRCSGFVQVGVRKNYYPNGAARENALVMKLALGK